MIGRKIVSPQFCAVTSCNRYRGILEAASFLTGASRLCGDCLDVLRARVARLPDLHRACGELLTGVRRAPVGRVTGRGAGGLSLNGAAVSARADILAVAASWAGLIADERRVAVRPSRQVTDLSRFLLSNLDWLARHPAADDAAAEFARVVAAAKAVLDPENARRVDLGNCDVPGCSGTLRAIFGGRASGVSCDRGHARRASEWLSMARRASRHSVAAGTGGR
jgi:hypothetical protein